MTDNTFEEFTDEIDTSLELKDDPIPVVKQSSSNITLIGFALGILLLLFGIGLGITIISGDVVRKYPEFISDCDAELYMANNGSVCYCEIIEHHSDNHYGIAIMIGIACMVLPVVCASVTSVVLVGTSRKKDNKVIVY